MSKYTKEACISFCRNLDTIEELKECNFARYKFIVANHWEDVCFAHMPQPIKKERKKRQRKPESEINKPIKHSLEECIAICKQYQTRKDLKAANNTIYQYVVDHFWRRECFAHMHRSGTPNDTPPMPVGDGNKHRTLRQCIEEIQLGGYKTLKELYTQNKTLYSYIHIHNFQDACFADLVRCRQKIEEPPLLAGPAQRLTYKFRIPHREDLDRYMQVANNLYNQALWTFRHALDDKENQQWLSFFTLRDIMKTTPNLDGEINYLLMPNTLMADKVIQDLATLCNVWAAQMRDHQSGQPWPHLPGYKPKGGMTAMRTTRKNSRIRDGVLTLAKGVTIRIPDYERYASNLRYYVGTTIIPHHRFIEVAVQYDRAITPNPSLDESSYAAIDIGLDNLVTMVDQYQATIYCGRFLKSYNQHYNDQMRILRKQARQQGVNHRTHYTSRMQTLSDNRVAYVNDIMHKLSHHIVEYLKAHHIGVLIVGWNPDIKQGKHLNRNTRRMFQLIPHGRLIADLRYKCEAAGIGFITTEESHTSKCDALALEPICHHETYLGRRTHRGLFQSSTGKLINADVNGALNIMRKVIGDSSFVREILDMRHLFNPVSYKNPSQYITDKS